MATKYTNPPIASTGIYYTTPKGTSRYFSFPTEALDRDNLKNALDLISKNFIDNKGAIDKENPEYQRVSSAILQMYNDFSGEKYPEEIAKEYGIDVSKMPSKSNTAPNQSTQTPTVPTQTNQQGAASTTKNIGRMPDQSYLIKPKDNDIAKAIFGRETRMGYQNYGFTKEGGNVSKEQALSLYNRRYAPQIESLPKPLQAVAGDFLFNSENPYASLLVASGKITPDQKIGLYKNGKLDDIAVNELWKQYGNDVLAQYNQNPSAFLDAFDKERLRSYSNSNGASTHLPEWKQRITQSRKQANSILGLKTQNKIQGAGGAAGMKQQPQTTQGIVPAGNTPGGVTPAITQNPDSTVSIIPTGNSILDANFTKAAENYNKLILSKNKADNELAKKSAIGTMVLNSAAGVLGLGQMIGAKKVLKNNKPPKFPSDLLPNQQLQARLGDVQRLSQVGDPAIREAMLRDLALEKAQQDAVAKVSSGGDVSAYAAQSQVNAGRMGDEIRKIGMAEQGLKTEQGRILDNLIAQKMQEDANIRAGKVDKFKSVDYPEFAKRRQYGENLVNQGIGNLFAAGVGASQAASIIGRTKSNAQAMNAQNQPQIPNPADTTTPTQSQAEAKQLNDLIRGVLPGTYGLIEGKKPSSIIGSGVLLPSVQIGRKPQEVNPNWSGVMMNGVKPVSQATTPTMIDAPALQTPSWFNKTYQKANDMAYMATPEGYQQYLSKVRKLTPQQIMEAYQGATEADVQKILKDMTDYKIGDAHRKAQDLITKYGL